MCWPQLCVSRLAERCSWLYWEAFSQAYVGQGLPSLDIHLLRRGAILHLTLCGGACREEMQSRTFSGGKKGPNKEL